MIETVLIVIFLFIAGLGLAMLKILKYYLKMCKIAEQEGGGATVKITDIFKKSIAFFVLLNFIFLLLFLIF